MDEVTLVGFKGDNMPPINLSVANKKKNIVYVVLNTEAGEWPWEDSPVIKIGKDRNKIEQFVKDYNAKHATVLKDGYVIDEREVEE